jgi:hypothetical protein
MLLAILVVGAILALALGVNPLTFQKLTPEPIATTAPTSVSQIGIATPTAGVTPLAIATLAPAVAPTAIPTAASTPAAAGAPQAAPTTVAIPTPATAAAPGALPTSPPEPTSLGTAPTVVATDQGVPTPVQASVSPELAAAIIQGYDNYWSVRVRAMGDPADTSIDLESVMTNDELSAAHETLAQYRDNGEAYQATIHHQIWITKATSSVAEIVDQFTATTIKLDPQTKQPVETTPQVEHITGRFLLQPIDGVWKVIGRAQED